MAHKRKRRALLPDFVPPAPYGEYIIRQGKGNLSNAFAASPALERKLREGRGAKELDCPPDFFTEPLDG